MTMIAKCPGCGKPCLTNDDSLPSIKRPASKHWVFCEDTDYCQYSSASRLSLDEAIASHNALCRQGVPVEELEALQRHEVIAQQGMGLMMGYHCFKDDNGDYLLWADVEALLERHKQQEGGK